MPSLMREILTRAQSLGVPFSAQLDVTWRCNERCVHCYVPRDGDGEMAAGEIRGILNQLAAAGTLFLSVSGGEPLVREDLFDILDHARALRFDIRLKTNGTLICPGKARRIRSLPVHEVHVSIYSLRPELHDGVTGVPGSLERSLSAVRLMRSLGQQVILSHSVTRRAPADHAAIKALAVELGAGFRIDPAITPRLDGDDSALGLNVTRSELVPLMQNLDYVEDVEEFCAAPVPASEAVLDGFSCSAGFSHVYISPTGEVYPCVQFPLVCGNLRQRTFRKIWRESTQLIELRSISNRGLPVCSGCSHLPMCTRCPGLAYMEGDLRGPSVGDCEKSFARTGVVPTGRPELAEGKFRYWKAENGSRG